MHYVYGLSLCKRRYPHPVVGADQTIIMHVEERQRPARIAAGWIRKRDEGTAGTTPRLPARGLERGGWLGDRAAQGRCAFVMGSRVLRNRDKEISIVPPKRVLAWFTAAHVHSGKLLTILHEGRGTYMFRPPKRFPRFYEVGSNGVQTPVGHGRADPSRRGSRREYCDHDLPVTP